LALSGTALGSEVTTASQAVQGCAGGAVLLIVGRRGRLHAVRKV
jgi:hypothetical protein